MEVIGERAGGGFIEDCSSCSIAAASADEMEALVVLGARAGEFCLRAAELMRGKGGQNTNKGAEAIAALGALAGALSESGAATLSRAGEGEFSAAFADVMSKIAGALAGMAERSGEQA